MEIDALLCDHAQVQGKLFISGASINLFTIAPEMPAPYVIGFAVAGVVRVPWTATNQEHKMLFRIETQDLKIPELAGGAEAPPEGIGGEMVFNVGRPPDLPLGDDQLVPFAFQFGGIPLAKLGPYIVRLAIDGTDVKQLPFRLLKPPLKNYGPATPGPMG